MNLPVAKTTLTRVFAIGVAATNSMDAVVQVLPIATRGSGSDVSRVDAGNGGQAQALIAAHRPGAADPPARTPSTAVLATWAALALAALGLGAGSMVGARRRAARVVARVGAPTLRGTRHT